MKDKKICCICKKPFEGYGNNPVPVMDGGECCDKCNADVVLPIRLAQAVKVRAADDIKTVYIPAREQHGGVYGMYVKLWWVCPICGQPRGQIKNVRSYDGSRVLPCDGWDNPCGHVDKYDACRKEAAENGLNVKPAEGTNESYNV